MGERNAEQLEHYLRERLLDVLPHDNASEDEDDKEEIENEVLDEQDADEDTDFDPPGRQAVKEEGDEEFEPQEIKPGRRRSILKGRNNFKWSTNAPETQGLRTTLYLPSAKDAARNVTTPLEAWSLLFSSTMLETIVQHTNEEIARKAHFSDQTYNRMIDAVELNAFIGLLYFSGLQKNNHLNLDELWSPQFGHNLYRAVMSQQRFQFILTSVRFDDKNTRNERKAEHGLAPIKELWDSFIENCKKYYSPSNHCTIDEQLLGFRGSFGGRVYMGSKPERYGIKIVMCNDAQTSYMLNAEPYIGWVAPDPGDSVPTYYVKKLSEPIHNSERNVTCDNWFMSVSVVQEMKERYSLTMVGTLRKNNREIPPSFTQTAVAGTTRFAYANGITLLSYCPKRNKVVLLLSTLHKAGRTNEEDGKPEIVTFYNETKGGTDTFDQLCKNYTVSRITKRWPLRLFYGMLDQAGVNVAILYNLRAANNALNRRSFLKELAFSLIKSHLEVRFRIPTLRKNIKSLISEILGVNEPSPQNRVDKLKKRKRCSVCTWKQNKKTLYCCASCGKPVCEEHRTHFCNNCAL